MAVTLAIVVVVVVVLLEQPLLLLNTGGHDGLRRVRQPLAVVYFAADVRALVVLVWLFTGRWRLRLRRSY